MKLQMTLIAALLLPALAQANSPELTALKNQNSALGMKLDTCLISVRTVFVQLRAQMPMTEAAELEKCVTSGKESIKSAHAEVKSAFKKKRVPDELTDWRLEWMATFDAAVLQSGDREGAYMARVKEARSKVERATNKVEIVLE